MKTVPAILVFLASGKSALIQATESTLELDDGLLIVHGEDEVGDVTFNWDHVAYYRDYDFEVPEEDAVAKMIEQATQEANKGVAEILEDFPGGYL